MTKTVKGLNLQRLQEETWGRRLQRAREQAALTLDGVSRLLGPTTISSSTLSRMEARLDAPASAKERQRAFLVMVLYGIDPQELGLTSDDVPPFIDLREVRTLAIASSPCIAYGEAA